MTQGKIIRINVLGVQRKDSDLGRKVRKK